MGRTDAEKRALDAKILELPMQRNDAGAATIGDYLIKLLDDLWHHREAFNGKRPFGNSGWEYELYEALVRGGAVRGEIHRYEDDGEVFEELGEFDKAMANVAIYRAIHALGNPKDTPSHG